MPRLTACRATSLWLHWLMGRPLSFGSSQASARIAQTCSGVNLPGAPQRGASLKRSAVLFAASAARQRWHHRLAVPAERSKLLALLRCQVQRRSYAARHACLHRLVRWRPYEPICPALTRVHCRQTPLTAEPVASRTHLSDDIRHTSRDFRRAVPLEGVIADD